MGGKIFVVMTQVLLISLVKCEPCSKEQSINVTSGDFQAEGLILHDGIVYKPGQWYELEENGTVSRFGCPCLDRVCLRKCCNSRDMYLDTSCQEAPEEPLRIFSPKVYKGTDLLNVTAHLHFFYLHNLDCNKYLVDPFQEPEYLYIQENGTLLEVSNDKEKMQWIAPSEYCVDMMMDGTDQASLRMVAAVCFARSNSSDDSPVLYISYAIGLLLSVPFLLATFMVYAFIPDLRNLHGMCLMAYCSGLIVAYIFLAYLKMHFGEDGGDTMTGCMVIAFIVYYAFQTSFFWLNVMCFDIWRTFSGYRGSSSTKRRELRRFTAYGLYAWGVPLLLTACTVSMQFVKLPRWVITPGFGEKKCWFSDWMSELVYFFTPVLILVICNLVLFTVTAYRIRSIRQETAILKGAKSTSKLKQDKQRYSLYLKLFIVMGINWSVELISFVVGGSNWYWILVDISNIMLGFFIFMIFVWKKKVRNLARRRYRSIRGLPPVSSSDFRKSTNVTSTAVTEESRLSSDDAHLRMRDLN